MTVKLRYMTYYYNNAEDLHKHKTFMLSQGVKIFDESEKELYVDYIFDFVEEEVVLNDLYN